MAHLCENVPGATLPLGAADVRIARVRDDSRSVEPGDLFVAVAGGVRDGSDYAAEAVRRGAAAIVAEKPLDAAVPVVVVSDARTALARLAATAFDHPARRLRMVGITGTVGKTSVLSMLDAILDTARIPAGTIGSLGVHFPGYAAAGVNTTPGALTLHEALSGMVAAGVSVAAMEVTSHALAQHRVHGLELDLGIFTNLTMLEHLEYHRSFRDYALTKLRFFEHLRAGAPLVYAAGDRVVRQAARRHGGPRISCGGGRSVVHVRRNAMTLYGTRITLDVRAPLPRLDGSQLDPLSIAISLRTLGRPNIMNATLAAAAGLCLGAPAEAVVEGLGRVEPPKRRLEVVRPGDPIIIDDTVGHPDSINGVFELAERVRHRRLRVVFCIRGCRGVQINAREAETLAIWSRRVRLDALHTTSAEDTADERNRVSAAERDAFLGALRRSGISHTHHARLEDAIAASLDGAADRDLVLLLGAQGMDAGAGMADRLLAARTN